MKKRLITLALLFVFSRVYIVQSNDLFQDSKPDNPDKLKCKRQKVDGLGKSREFAFIVFTVDPGSSPGGIQCFQ